MSAQSPKQLRKRAVKVRKAERSYSGLQMPVTQKSYFTAEARRYAETDAEV